MEKCHSIEFLRFMFMLFICLWHFNHMIPHGYLAVDFFFMLSGVFLYKTSGKDINTLEYFRKRIDRFFFPYIMALFLAIIIHWRRIVPTNSITDVFLGIMTIFKEVLCLQELGWYSQNTFNYPTWYISVLLICSFALFYLVKKNKRLMLNIVLPLIILIGYTILYNDCDMLDVSGNFIFLNRRLLRGVCAMSVGLLIGTFGDIYKKTMSRNLVYDIISALSFILTIIIFFIYDAYDYSVIILYPIIIFSAFNESSLLFKLTNYKYWDRFGGLTLSLLLTHGSIGLQIVRIKHFYEFNEHILALLYIVWCLIVAYIFDIIVKHLQKKINASSLV